MGFRGEQIRRDMLACTPSGDFRGMYNTLHVYQLSSPANESQIQSSCLHALNLLKQLKICTEVSTNLFWGHSRIKIKNIHYFDEFCSTDAVIEMHQHGLELNNACIISVGLLTAEVNLFYN